MVGGGQHRRHHHHHHRRLKVAAFSQNRRTINFNNQYQHCYYSILVTSVFIIIIIIISVFFFLSSTVLSHANSLGRRCYPMTTMREQIEAEYPQPSTSTSAAASVLKIAMVSFSSDYDGGEISDQDNTIIIMNNNNNGKGDRFRRGRGKRRGGGRSFKGLMEVVGGNKRSYAERMGYDFIDASSLVDPDRPPSWSKITALLSYLNTYHWLFWNDADTIVANPHISLENILKAAIGHLDFRASPDLVVTEDVNGVNAGVFFVRRSEWSEQFLEKWWNQTSFIQFGSSKSGDNAAMKHLIYNGLSPEELEDHVRISPMQCLFNSYPWNPTFKSAYRLFSSPQPIWKGAYSKGDFMVHLAGFDNKREWAIRILQGIETDS